MNKNIIYKININNLFNYKNRYKIKITVNYKTNKLILKNN